MIRKEFARKKKKMFNDFAEDSWTWLEQFDNTQP